MAQQRKKSAAPPPPRPIRREVGGGVCAFVCLLLFLYTGDHSGEPAVLLRWLGDGFSGLLGAGFYLLPFAFALAAVILLVHRGRPVRLRLIAAFAIPFCFGGFHQLIKVPKPSFRWSSFADLVRTGVEHESGGFLSGGVVLLLRPVISGAGVFVVLLFLLITAFLILIRRTPGQIIGFFMQKWQNRPRPLYEPEPESAPAPRPHRAPAAAPLPAKQPKAGSSNVPDSPHVRERRKNFKIPNREELPEFDPTASVEPPPAPPIPILDKAPLVMPDFDPPIDREILAHDRLYAATKEESETPPNEPSQAIAHDPQPNTEPQAPPAPVAVKGDDLPPWIPDTPPSAPPAKGAMDSNMKSPPPFFLPPTNLLTAVRPGQVVDASEELKQGADRLIAALASFSIGVTIEQVTRGPSVTRYEIQLDAGIPLQKLTSRAGDIALALGAVGVHIAPVTGKVNLVGIEVPNKLVSTVYIRELIEGTTFKGKQSQTGFVLGRDIGGNDIVGDIQKLVHLLIAGTTGSGKSVCINSLIVSMLYKASPEELKFIMIDPKMVELGMYNGIPHLLTPVVSDPQEAAQALDWAVVEMDSRYKKLMERGKRDIDSYNEAVRNDNSEISCGANAPTPMPRIVIIIDEMADLMMVARKEVETAVARIAQKARACGVHLILATQRPEAKVVTGIIKANIPSRIALLVKSSLDSRIILDETGAEKLVGRGDMLYLPNGAPRATRVQGCWVSEGEVEKVVAHLKQFAAPPEPEEVFLSEQLEEHLAEAATKKESGSGGTTLASRTEGFQSDEDELLPAAIEAIVESGQGSTSYLQRRLKVGFARAGRLMDLMEERGIVGPFEGSKPRKVLMSYEEWLLNQ